MGLPYVVVNRVNDIDTDIISWVFGHYQERYIADRCICIGASHRYNTLIMYMNIAYIHQFMIE